MCKTQTIKHIFFSFELIVLHSTRIYLLDDSNGQIITATSDIIPTDLVAHQRFEEFDTNTSDLPKRRIIEAINTYDVCNEIQTTSQ